MEKLDSRPGFKMGSFYFTRSHMKRIWALLLIVLLVLCWSFWSSPTVRIPPKPGIIMTDFEPLELPNNHHYNISNKSSLKYNKRQFYLDGKPLTILSGSMHYFRVPRLLWEDRMKKMKACGLNTLETYVAWNKHEEVKGHFTFEDNLDLRRYIKMAHSLGLYVILRPGPYICAEWDLGGLPSWLLHDPNMKLRTNYPPYLEAVESFFKKILPKVVDLQYSKGGPIIMVQVENEFGGYSDEVEHLKYLQQLLVSHGINEMFVTSEGAVGLLKAPLYSALPTVNFQKLTDAEQLLDAVHRSHPQIPLMVMEFWTGWFDHWGKPHELVSTDRILEPLQYILSMRSSVNLYMFHGGTSFGFFAGANYFSVYNPDITSYDYGALLTEEGDTTRKYTVVRNLFFENILQPAGITSLPDPPPNSPKAAYGELELESYLVWEDLLKTVDPISSKETVTMEMLDINNGGGQGHGYILYRKQIHTRGILSFGEVKDRAQILQNGEKVAITSYGNMTNQIQLPQLSGVLDILVENLGRVNYVTFKSPVLNDQRRGLRGDVLLNDQKLTDWQIYPLEFNGKMLSKIAESEHWKKGFTPIHSPTVFRGTLNIEGEPEDTFVFMKGWIKGAVFVNRYNLGRYWHIGPQRTLYLPAPFLRKGTNEVLIFEEEMAQPTMFFLDKQSLG